jgi:hypothetical protein
MRRVYPRSVRARDSEEQISADAARRAVDAHATYVRFVERGVLLDPHASAADRARQAGGLRLDDGRARDGERPIGAPAVLESGKLQPAGRVLGGGPRFDPTLGSVSGHQRLSCTMATRRARRKASLLQGVAVGSGQAVSHASSAALHWVSFAAHPEEVQHASKHASSVSAHAEPHVSSALIMSPLVAMHAL